jgi:predicted Fe-Mo cluster-binding NifX family protein
MKYEAVQNASQYAPHGAGIQAAQTIVSRGVQVVLTGNVGPNAYQVLSSVGIKIVIGVTGTVREAVAKYERGELKEADSPTVGGHSGMRGGRGMGRWRRWR